MTPSIPKRNKKTIRALLYPSHTSLTTQNISDWKRRKAAFFKDPFQPTLSEEYVGKYWQNNNSQCEKGKQTQLKYKLFNRSEVGGKIVNIWRTVGWIGSLKKMLSYVFTHTQNIYSSPVLQLTHIHKPSSCITYLSI